MKLIRYIKNLFIKKVDINITNLPSRGMFYNDNFKIAIKKAELDDIEEYEDDYEEEPVKPQRNISQPKKISKSSTSLGEPTYLGHKILSPNMGNASL